MSERSDFPAQEPEPVTEADAEAVSRQLGRPIRSAHAVAWRCPCGQPAVIETEPRLDDGTPFPTTYYLTCPKASSAIGRLEGGGVMKEMTARLDEDADLADEYREAHEDYLARRAKLGDVPEIDGYSAGGMPERVKCLHALVGHSLAAGPGVNPLGDEALEMLPHWWKPVSCCDEQAAAE
ncbi:DUF501 domain-containing protein [Salininema proteolyticum]|uniref:DUF501 domain-containing protein n=1 Tax=Salininema proteolyticum TaxID=1607685 RepID=A0ABV8TSP1_9ACTN